MLFKYYYLLTPIFFILDMYFGDNLRVELPWEVDYYAYIYMGVCFFLGGFLLKEELHLNIFAIVESSLNMLFLALSVFVPVVYRAADVENNNFDFGVPEIIQFGVVSAVLLYGFYNNPFIKRKSQA